MILTICGWWFSSDICCLPPGWERGSPGPNSARLNWSWTLAATHRCLPKKTIRLGGHLESWKMLPYLHRLIANKPLDTRGTPEDAWVSGPRLWGVLQVGGWDSHCRCAGRFSFSSVAVCQGQRFRSSPGVSCSFALRYIVLYYIILHYIILYYYIVILYYIKLYYIILCNTKLYCIILYYLILYYLILY